MRKFFGGGNQMQASFREIAEDLMNLEVNTIIQTSLMTARKAPRPHHALLDIAGEYQGILTGALPHGFGLAPRRARRAENPQAKAWEQTFGELTVPQVAAATFRDLYVTARAGLEGSEDPEKETPSEVKEAVLWRIRRSCVDIATILDRLEYQSKSRSFDPGWAFGLTRQQINDQDITRPDDGRPDLEITHREWVMIRKVWEISIEQIAMQTVIQLDGDVVTRLCRSHATEKHAHLWKAHMESTQVAMESWRFLVDTVGRFLTATAKLIRGK